MVKFDSGENADELREEAHARVVKVREKCVSARHQQLEMCPSAPPSAPPASGPRAVICPAERGEEGEQEEGSQAAQRSQGLLD